jgi:hypothetical protein
LLDYRNLPYHTSGDYGYDWCQEKSSHNQFPHILELGLAMDRAKEKAEFATV